MNEHDRNNLNFLLNVSEDVLKDWYFSVDEDDIQYAIELLTMAEVEMDYELYEKDCIEARQYLSKFMLQ